MRPYGSAVSLRAADMGGGGHQRVMPYPLINGKAAGGEHPPPPAREGLHGAAPSVLLGTTVNDLVVEQESR